LEKEPYRSDDFKPDSSGLYPKICPDRDIPEDKPTKGERIINKEIGVYGAEYRKNRAKTLDKRAKNRNKRKRKNRKR
jgi:hypothetical protein